MDLSPAVQTVSEQIGTTVPRSALAAPTASTASAPVVRAKRQVVCARCKRGNVTLYRIIFEDVALYSCANCRR